MCKRDRVSNKEVASWQGLFLVSQGIRLARKPPHGVENKTIQWQEIRQWKITQINIYKVTGGCEFCIFFFLVNDASIITRIIITQNLIALITHLMMNLHLPSLFMHSWIKQLCHVLRHHYTNITHRKPSRESSWESGLVTGTRKLKNMK